MPTPHLALEPLAAAQAQKHVTVNEALARIDAATQLAILTRTLAAPPAAPADGDRYLVAEAASDAWTGQGGNIASWDAAAQLWLFLAPREGWRLWVADEARYLIRDATGWREIGGTSLNPVPDGLLGVNTGADETNRMAVKSDAVLFSHDDVTPGTGDMRVAINRAADANSASLIFQTGYSGNAEIGLVGPDTLALRTASDGGAFTDAIRIDLTDASVSLPGGADFEHGLTIAQIAEASESTATAARRAATGNPGHSPTTVLEADTLAGPNTVIASAEDHNTLSIDGAYVATLARGEVYSASLAPGARIETSRGHAGASASPGGPMPLGPDGMAAREFIFFTLRSSRESGHIRVASTGLPAKVELRDATGIVIEDGPFDLAPGGVAALTAPRTGEEYRILADRPVIAAVRVDDKDHRLVPPPACQLIGHARSARISALYPDTTISWWLRDGQSGSFTASPGLPASFIAETGIVVAAGLASDGFVILRADAPISAVAGSDGDGYAAAPFIALDMLGQRAPFPFQSEGGQPSRASSIAIASAHEGKARIYAPDGALLAELPLLRGTASPATSAAEQAVPAAALYTPPAGVSVGPGGYIEADVPVYVLQNASGPLNAFPVSAEEIFLPAITPDDIRAEFRRDGAGLLRRRIIDPAGSESWVSA